MMGYAVFVGHGVSRSLREARDGACAERDRVLAGHKELEEKHERLLAE